jgi:hypothetical protein
MSSPNRLSDSSYDPVTGDTSPRVANSSYGKSHNSHIGLLTTTITTTIISTNW